MTVHAQGKTQKRFEKTSSLYLRLMTLRTKTAYNTPKNNNKKQADHGEEKESDFQSYRLIRFKCPVFNNNKKHEAYKETGK